MGIYYLFIVHHRSHDCVVIPHCSHGVKCKRDAASMFYFGGQLKPGNTLEQFAGGAVVEIPSSLRAFPGSLISLMLRTTLLRPSRKRADGTSNTRPSFPKPWSFHVWFPQKTLNKTEEKHGTLEMFLKKRRYFRHENQSFKLGHFGECLKQVIINVWVLIQS